ncbi:MAG: M1 family metallopeptidase [Gammaproteobacteria bacterium]|nr:M1 family metallopeptidase [Gammaproteobacteria bacterium]
MNSSYSASTITARAIMVLAMLFTLPSPATTATTPEVVHHQLKVAISPQDGNLQVEDTITLPRSVTQLEFYLHDGLSPKLSQTQARLSEGSGNQLGAVPVRRYTIETTLPGKKFSLKYGGEINHPLSNQSEGYSGGRQSTPGIISPEGVFLSISSAWFPIIDGYPITFALDLDLPDGWTSISQGEEHPGGWAEQNPQDDIYLIAGRYQVTHRKLGELTSSVYLHQTDDALTSRYLDTTEHYIALYQSLIGPYPYSKFALVENFWESGYGMPSFTLMGPRVIRFPFILHSSYPHEILHNWWGNGVYVDYTQGNWSEGLTSYLADHLIKETRGGGATYRRETLQRYADYVSEAADFPLTQFRGNHGQISQAVGYGRTLMLFHMLRRQLGDEKFVAGLRRFYQDNRYRSAGFRELQSAFEQSSGESLKAFFRQWTRRIGAPSLALTNIKVTHRESDVLLTATLRQTQKERPFSLRVPLYIHTEGSTTPQRCQIELNQSTREISLPLASRPLSIQVDPLFDLFRQLAPGETPSSISQLLGAENPLIVLPSQARKEMQQAFHDLAHQWKQRSTGINIIQDSDLPQFIPDRPIWLFGKENLHLKHLLGRLKTQPITVTDSHLTIQRNEFTLNDHLSVITADSKGKAGMIMGAVLATSPSTLSTLARKLPHYGKYSYLVFSSEVKNLLKGVWNTNDSPLLIKLESNPDRPISHPHEKPLIDIIQ